MAASQSRDHVEERKRWVQKACDAFEVAIKSPEFTDFDKLLMKGQLSRVKEGLSASFPDTDSKEIKTLRSTRLKLLGYTWNPNDKSWSKKALL